MIKQTSAVLILAIGFLAFSGWKLRAQPIQREVGTAEPTTSDSENTEPQESPDPQRAPLPVQITDLTFVRQMVSGDPNLQFQALPRVSPRGLDATAREEVVRLLLPLLKSEHADIRTRAAEAISLFTPECEVAIPHLVELLSDTAKNVRLQSVWSIASDALIRIGTASIPVLEKELPNATGTQFFGITAVLAGLGEHTEAQATAPFFLEHLRSGPAHHRWATMYCLSKLGDVAKPAIPEYLNYLGDSNFNLQVIACRALAEQGQDAKAAIPRLIELTQKKGNVLSTRTHAAMCLGAIGPVDPEVNLVELFKAMIAEPNAFCQERGLIALGRLGKHASSAAEFVVGLFENEDFSQRPEAALTLWQITGDGKRSVELLRPLMSNMTYDLRALEVIQTIGPAAAEMADEVAKYLESEDASLQLMAAEALVAMGVAEKYLERLRTLPDQAPPDIAIELDSIIQGLERG